MIMTGLLSFFMLNSDHSISVGIGNLIGLQGVFFEPYAGNGPLWSLAYEIWFYILAGSLASVAIFKSNKVGFYICFALLISSLCIFTKLDCTYLYIWGFGAIAYFYRDLIRKNGSSLVGVFCTLVGLLACQLTSESQSIFFENLSYLLPSKSVAEIMLGAGIAILLPFITNYSPQNNILVRIERLGISLAAFSYTLYLTHYPFLWAINKFWPRVSNIDESSILRFLIVIILSILVAWIFFFPFEAQTNKVRKWLLIKFC